VSGPTAGHLVEITPLPTGFTVFCHTALTPGHGSLGEYPTHLEAFTAGFEHDWNCGGQRETS